MGTFMTELLPGLVILLALLVQLRYLEWRIEQSREQMIQRIEKVEKRLDIILRPRLQERP